MTIEKRLLRPERQRQIPPQFSWIDHRLIRHQHLRECDPPAWGLYLVTVTVADAQGLSYYSDAALGRMLHLSPEQLGQARQQLLAADVLAYEKPLYQVLALPNPKRWRKRTALQPTHVRRPNPPTDPCLGRCRMIDYQTFQQIRLYADQQGLKVAQIARLLDFDERTVAHWVGQKTYAPPKRAKRASKLDPFKGTIVRLLESGADYSAQQIFQRLRAEGYDGGYSILKDFARPVRPVQHPAFLSLNFAPGQCAQVDWGSAGVLNVGSAQRRVSFFVMVLAYSRRMYSSSPWRKPKTLAGLPPTCLVILR